MRSGLQVNAFGLGRAENRKNLGKRIHHYKQADVAVGAMNPIRMQVAP